MARADEVGEQPRRFTLLDEYIVMFRDDEGPIAFKDLCIHRGTALSLGWVSDGTLHCGYHGWAYDRTGTCVRIPALREGIPIPARARAISYKAVDAYGLVWVALDEPISQLPPWPEDERNSGDYRSILREYSWDTSAGRAMENFLDFSHFAFVHSGLIGIDNDPPIEPHEIVKTDYGFRYSTNRKEPTQLGKEIGDDPIRRDYYVYMPFTAHIRKSDNRGRVNIITLMASPTSKKRTRLFMFNLRNHSFDKDDRIFEEFGDTVMEQDRRIVESQRPEELPVALREEFHIKIPDAAGVTFRRLLGEIVEDEEFVG